MHYAAIIFAPSIYYRCKLFYKKENEFKEKGVGTLHLKLVSEGRLQLLVRADTNLGKTHSWSNKHEILFFNLSTWWNSFLPSAIKMVPVLLFLHEKYRRIDNACIFCSGFSRVFGGGQTERPRFGLNVRHVTALKEEEWCEEQEG